jgi:hypothetical protein
MAAVIGTIWLFAGEYQMVMRGDVPSAAPATGEGAM